MRKMYSKNTKYKPEKERKNPIKSDFKFLLNHITYGVIFPDPAVFFGNKFV